MIASGAAVLAAGIVQRRSGRGIAAATVAAAFPLGLGTLIITYASVSLPSVPSFGGFSSIALGVGPYLTLVCCVAVFLTAATVWFMRPTSLVNEVLTVGVCLMLLSAAVGGGFMLGKSAGDSYAAEQSESTSNPPDAADAEPAKIMKFGQTTKFENGVSVLLSTPRDFTPSASAIARSKGARYIAMTMQVMNTNPKPLRPSGVTSVSASAGGSACKRIFDLRNGLEGGPTVDILPGKYASWKVGFACPAASRAELTAQVNDGAGGGSKALYVGRLP